MEEDVREPSAPAVHLVKIIDAVDPLRMRQQVVAAVLDVVPHAVILMLGVFDPNEVKALNEELNSPGMNGNDGVFSNINVFWHEAVTSKASGPVARKGRAAAGNLRNGGIATPEEVHKVLGSVVAKGATVPLA